MYITRNKKYVLTSVHLLLPFIDKYRILKGTQYCRRNTILLHFQFSYINSYCSAMSISIFANFNLTGRHNWTIDQGNTGLKIDRLKQLYVEHCRVHISLSTFNAFNWSNVMNELYTDHLIGFQRLLVRSRIPYAQYGKIFTWYTPVHRIHCLYACLHV